MRPSLHWKNMENLIFPRKGGGIFEKLLDFTEKFYIIVELVICIAGKSLLTHESVWAISPKGGATKNG